MGLATCKGIIMTRQDRAIIRVALEEHYTGVETTPDVCIDPTHRECDPMDCILAAYAAMDDAKGCEECGYVAGHPRDCRVGRITS